METTTKKINLPSWIPKEDEIDERETTKIEVNGTKITVRFWYHLTTGQRKIIKGYLESGWEKPGRIGRTHIEWDAPSVLKLSKKIPSWEGSVWESIIVEIVSISPQERLEGSSPGLDPRAFLLPRHAHPMGVSGHPRPIPLFLCPPTFGSFRLLKR